MKSPNLRIVLTLLSLPLTLLATACHDELTIGVQGILYMADGVTPLPNAGIQTMATLDDEYFTELDGSVYDAGYPTTVGPDGSFYADIKNHNTPRGDVVKITPATVGTISVKGSIGVLVEARIPQFSPAVRKDLEEQILANCTLEFKSIDYRFTGVELTTAGSGFYEVKQDFVVNVTAEDVARIQKCQDNAVDLATGQ